MKGKKEEDGHGTPSRENNEEIEELKNWESESRKKENNKNAKQVG